MKRKTRKATSKKQETKGSWCGMENISCADTFFKIFGYERLPILLKNWKDGPC